MTRPKKRGLKETVEKELVDMFKTTNEPSEGRMKLLKTAIGFLAVNAKLEESEYGGFFGSDDTSSIPLKQGKKPVARQPAGGDEEGTNGGDSEPGSSFFEEGTGRLPN